MNLSSFTTPCKGRLQWFVLFTMPHHEKQVSENLTRIGIETFLPLRKEVRQWSDRKKKILVPLFPNYLFVNIRRIDRYKVFYVPNVVRYLDSNLNPTAMPEKAINLIRQLEAGEDIEVTSDTFSKGDAVMITSGPLRNISGVLVDRRGGKRLLLQIETIKRNILIDVAPYQLKKIGQHEEELVEVDSLMRV